MDTPRSTRNKFNLSVDLRYICLLLLVIIAALLLLWRPWDAGTVSNDRTVEVTGQATLKAEPDEFVFNPSYTFTNDSRQASVDAASAKSDELLKKLKELGVAPSKIKSNTSGYDERYYIQPAASATDTTYTLTLTITVSGRPTAQKVQDYLATTAPIGSVSPQASFSNTMRKMLENKARDQAIRDARAKADQSAENLDFKVARVKSVNDGAGFDGITTFRSQVQGDVSEATAAAPSLSVQPGENDLNYSVTVVYYIR